ncbi:hypothetical protein, partial [Phocaeicola coprophilus]|uniref:hypothetical protein n=1 Tax=Phocaeicola coprophilus TaxID=387090 RepID=UPI002659535C
LCFISYRNVNGYAPEYAGCMNSSRRNRQEQYASEDSAETFHSHFHYKTKGRMTRCSKRLNTIFS